ncbi:uncharacterized protein LOC129401738 [Sorex araneus]|uniref:uncharacterized protein LOC129401738 n=1 Tax=Sorex araneus TaxID=42254 RepID=UPI00243366A1|nr:uncharacterized protein LOC129401738 [Sorex araneus]
MSCDPTGVLKLESTRHRDFKMALVGHKEMAKAGGASLCRGLGGSRGSPSTRAGPEPRAPRPAPRARGIAASLLHFPSSRRARAAEVPALSPSLRGQPAPLGGLPRKPRGLVWTRCRDLSCRRTLARRGKKKKKKEKGSWVPAAKLWQLLCSLAAPGGGGVARSDPRARAHRRPLHPGYRWEAASARPASGSRIRGRSLEVVPGRKRDTSKTQTKNSPAAVHFFVVVVVIIIIFLVNFFKVNSSATLAPRLAVNQLLPTASAFIPKYSLRHFLKLCGNERKS